MREKALKRQSDWKNKLFYMKSEVLYQLTVAFCNRFLPKYGDRTVDQMVQAARSGKQNIVEGLGDGVASTEMQLKLLNVARSSLLELREDYRDYAISHNLPLWDNSHPRYSSMVEYCKTHNSLEDYSSFFARWSDEEMVNCAITVCHMADALMNRYIKTLEEAFVKEGGIKERMYAARTGYRKQQDERLRFLEQENAQLKDEIARLKHLLVENGIVY